jgi:MFS family permease
VGFAVGAVVSAGLNLADRVRPHRLIAGSGLVGVASTVAFAAWSDGMASAVPLRFVTGMALAGVYPVGMKIVASWYPERRGTAFGVLIGALAMGTAVPQLLNGVVSWTWQAVLVGASACAAVGSAVAAAFVRLAPGSPPAPPLAPRYVLTMFRDPGQRLVCLGYFGHMWELYALWAWLPAYLAATHVSWWTGSGGRLSLGLTSFVVIGVAGFVGCAVGGRIADRWGKAEVARVAMILSAGCGLVSALLFTAVPALIVVLLLVWGITVIADSPQFSATLSELADPNYVGTALTVQTAIGFLLSVLTIQLLPVLANAVGWRTAMPVLAVGPLLGASAMHRLIRGRRREPAVALKV